MSGAEILVPLAVAGIGAAGQMGSAAMSKGGGGGTSPSPGGGGITSILNSLMNPGSAINAAGSMAGNPMGTMSSMVQPTPSPPPPIPATTTPSPGGSIPTFSYQPASFMGKPSPPPIPATTTPSPGGSIPTFSYQPASFMGKPSPPPQTTAQKASPYATAMGSGWDVYKFMQEQKNKRIPAVTAARTSPGARGTAVKVGQSVATGNPLERYAMMLRGF